MNTTELENYYKLKRSHKLSWIAYVLAPAVFILVIFQSPEILTPQLWLAFVFWLGLYRIAAGGYSLRLRSKREEQLINIIDNFIDNDPNSVKALSELEAKTKNKKELN